MAESDQASMGLAVESVWDYPRPPRLEPFGMRLAVLLGERILAETTQGWRILETSHPPTYYIPRKDVAMDILLPSDQVSFCEFKGWARYWHCSEPAIQNIAWHYDDPTAEFQQIAGHLSFYASKATKCMVGDMVVSPQAGDFYGGWITENLRGPFKGAPGTRHW